MKLTRREFFKRSLAVSSSLLLGSRSVFGANRSQVGYPGYAKLEKEGKLAQKVEEANAIFEECELCPRECGANRLIGEHGFCNTPAKPVVYTAHPHYGEEVSLVGKKGSGTIFFSNCNLRCVFCQNWPISIKGHGKEYTDEGLADMMIHLQKIGCHNINLVTPTHVMPNILSATRIALMKGLHLPLVYNTSGYESVEILRILDGIVDIYLPDMKYMDGDSANKYSTEASDYPEVARQAIIEMHRQVGVHRVDSEGVAVRGLMIRHLVMPNRIAGTETFIKWVTEHLPKSTYVNIMHQYAPAYKAFDYPEISRRINIQEYLEAMQWAEEYGLSNLDPRSVLIKKFYIKELISMKNCGWDKSSGNAL